MMRQKMRMNQLRMKKVHKSRVTMMRMESKKTERRVHMTSWMMCSCPPKNKVKN